MAMRWGHGGVEVGSPPCLRGKLCLEPQERNDTAVGRQSLRLLPELDIFGEIVRRDPTIGRNFLGLLWNCLSVKSAAGERSFVVGGPFAERGRASFRALRPINPF